MRHRGEDVAGHDPLTLRRAVAMVFQRPVTFAGTVLDNLREADRDCDEARGAELLERAGLPASFLARDAGELSGGEAQRACLARALATDPHVMLMDEPTSALDAKATAVLERLAKQLVAGGTPVVWVTHSQEQMRRLADFVLLIADGRVDREGSAQRGARRWITPATSASSGSPSRSSSSWSRSRSACACGCAWSATSSSPSHAASCSCSSSAPRWRSSSTPTRRSCGHGCGLSGS